MSWLSDRLGTTGSTPDFIKKAGNVIGGAVVNAVPFGIGDALDRIFNASGTQAPSSLADLIQRTGTNLQRQADQANALNSAQRQTSALVNGLMTPAGLILVAVALYLFLRRK